MIATSLRFLGKDPERRPGRPKRSLSPTPSVGRKAIIPSDVRFDKVAHWPELDGGRSRCRKCDMTCTVKCLNKDRNCFNPIQDGLF